MLINHGVRGSLPRANNNFGVYGGNTICVELKSSDVQLIFDCGTGFSKVKFTKDTPTIILFSHFHHDHIQGFPFNEFLTNGKKIFISSAICSKKELKNILQQYLSPPYFPVNFIELNKFFEFVDFKDLVKSFKDFNIESFNLNHPGGCSGYSVLINGKKFCTLLDNEYQDQQFQDLKTFCKNSEVVIWDGMYLDEELIDKKGWGHSSIEQGLKFLDKVDFSKLMISHHSPSRNDLLLEKISKKFKKSNVIIAEEDKEYKL